MCPLRYLFNRILIPIFNPIYNPIFNPTGNENINADDVEKDLQDVDINSHENHEEPTFDDMG